jgi:hypothetical protein
MHRRAPVSFSSWSKWLSYQTIIVQFNPRDCHFIRTKGPNALIEPFQFPSLRLASSCSLRRPRSIFRPSRHAGPIPTGMPSTSTFLMQRSNNIDLVLRSVGGVDHRVFGNIFPMEKIGHSARPCLTWVCRSQSEKECMYGLFALDRMS